MSDYKHPANPERIKAMQGIRSSSAASPQESRNKRLRTKQTILQREKQDWHDPELENVPDAPSAPYSTETPA